MELFDKFRYLDETITLKTSRKKDIFVDLLQIAAYPNRRNTS